MNYLNLESYEERQSLVKFINFEKRVFLAQIIVILLFMALTVINNNVALDLIFVSMIEQNELFHNRIYIDKFSQYLGWGLFLILSFYNFKISLLHIVYSLRNPSVQIIILYIMSSFFFLKNTSSIIDFLWQQNNFSDAEYYFLSILGTSLFSSIYLFIRISSTLKNLTKN